MLKWALIFFVVSLIAGFLGFSGVSAATAGIAKILFYIALIVFLIFLVLAFMAGSAINGGTASDVRLAAASTGSQWRAGGQIEFP
eukprot:gene33187-34024_t